MCSLGLLPALVWASTVERVEVEVDRTEAEWFLPCATEGYRVTLIKLACVELAPLMDSSVCRGPVDEKELPSVQVEVPILELLSLPSVDRDPIRPVWSAL